MNENEFKSQVGEKIAYYRKLNGMTQTGLAEKINYSDKAISKWERGDSLPDIYVLTRISELFGVTLNDFTGQDGRRDISEETSEKIYEEKLREQRFRRRMITALSVGLVWLSSSVIFFLFDIIVNNLFNKNLNDLWLIFVFSVPVSFIVALVFAEIWGKIWQRAVCVSGILWGTVTAVLLSFSASGFAPGSKYYIFIIAVFFQTLVILWYIMRKRSAKNKNK